MADWFTRQGFTVAHFAKGKARITTGIADGMVVYRLREQPGTDTWYKATSQGGLIVFELAVTEQGVQYNGYCPLLLFGIWERKLPFKADAGRLFAYRAEGWRVAQALQAVLRDQSVRS